MDIKDIAGKSLNFDVTKHHMTIGALTVNDYGEDTKISMKFSDLMTMTQGTDGATSFNKKAVVNGTFEVRILQNSPMATIMRAMAMAKKPYPISYGNLDAGGSGWFAPEAVFTKIPDEEIKEDAGTITFSMLAPNVKMMR